MAFPADQQFDAIDDDPIDLDHAIVVMAHIVMTHGSKYLPLLQRLEREKIAREDAQEALARAKIIAQQYSGGCGDGSRHGQ